MNETDDVVCSEGSARRKRGIGEEKLFYNFDALLKRYRREESCGVERGEDLVGAQFDVFCVFDEEFLQAYGEFLRRGRMIVMRKVARPSCGQPR